MDGEIVNQDDVSSTLIDHDIACLGDLVWSATSSVIQVETLGTYGVPDDDKLYNVWLQGDQPSEQDLAGYHSWFERVKSAVDRGVQVDRVHIVPQVLTPYLRFEMEIAYHKHCVPAGEEVHILQVNSDAQLALAVSGDFYLLDDSRLILPQYDDQNRFIGVKENLDRTAIAVHAGLRDRLLVKAEPFASYFERLQEASKSTPKDLPLEVPLLQLGD